MRDMAPPLTDAGGRLVILAPDAQHKKMGVQLIEVWRKLPRELGWQFLFIVRHRIALSRPLPLLLGSVAGGGRGNVWPTSLPRLCRQRLEG